MLGVGISALAAAAAGVLPEPISHVFPWAAGGSGSTVVQAHRLTSLPGPFGTRLEFWVTTDSDGRQCLNHVLVDADAPASSSLETALGYTAGGECGSPLREPGPEPDAFLCSGGGTGTVVYTCTAGRVTRAEVRLDDGGTLPATVVDGWVVGWLQTEYGRTATIVGYDDEGTVVARRSVHAAR